MTDHRQPTMDYRLLHLQKIVFVAVVGCLGSMVSVSAFAETAVVKRVIDGDTVVLADDTRVRLIGIDAPEIENRDYAHRGEAYGEEAKRLLMNWVEGKTVDLQEGPEKQDRYKRRLAYLYLDSGLSINLQMVESGAAKAYRKFPHPFQIEYIQAEARAKNAKAGLWSRPSKQRTVWQRLWGIQPE